MCRASSWPMVVGSQGISHCTGPETGTHANPLPSWLRQGTEVLSSTLVAFKGGLSLCLRWTVLVSEPAYRTVLPFLPQDS